MTVQLNYSLIEDYLLVQEFVVFFVNQPIAEFVYDSGDILTPLTFECLSISFLEMNLRALEILKKLGKVLSASVSYCPFEFSGIPCWLLRLVSIRLGCGLFFSVLINNYLLLLLHHGCFEFFPLVIHIVYWLAKELQANYCLNRSDVFFD